MIQRRILNLKCPQLRKNDYTFCTPRTQKKFKNINFERILLKLYYKQRYFINKLNDLTIGIGYLLPNSLKHVLEFFAIFSNYYRQSHIQWNQLAIKQRWWHISLHNMLSQTFRIGCLPYTRFLINTGLFFLLQDKIWMQRQISSSRTSSYSSTFTQPSPDCITNLFYQ